MPPAAGVPSPAFDQGDAMKLDALEGFFNEASKVLEVYQGDPMKLDVHEGFFFNADSKLLEVPAPSAQENRSKQQNDKQSSVSLVLVSPLPVVLQRLSTMSPHLHHPKLRVHRNSQQPQTLCCWKRKGLGFRMWLNIKKHI